METVASKEARIMGVARIPSLNSSASTSGMLHDRGLPESAAIAPPSGASAATITSASPVRVAASNAISTVVIFNETGAAPRRMPTAQSPAAIAARIASERFNIRQSAWKAAR